MSTVAPLSTSFAFALTSMPCFAVTVTADADVVVRATKGKLTLAGDGGVEISSGKGDVKITASKGIEVKANAKLVLKGATVDIN